MTDVLQHYYLFNLKKYLKVSMKVLIYSGCGDPPTFSDAVIKTVTGIFVNNEVIYKCLGGIQLQGISTLVCQADGYWSRRKFQCRGGSK